MYVCIHIYIYIYIYVYVYIHIGYLGATCWVTCCAITLFKRQNTWLHKEGYGKVNGK